MSTAKELLSLDYYSNLVGQFSLSNVWVQMVPWRWAGKVALVTSVGPWSQVLDLGHIGAFFKAATVKMDSVLP